MTFDASTGSDTFGDAQLSIAGSNELSVIPVIEVKTTHFSDFSNIKEINCNADNYCEVDAGSISMTESSDATVINLPPALTLKFILDSSNVNLGNIKAAKTKVDSQEYKVINSVNLPSIEPIAEFIAQVSIADLSATAHVQSIIVTDGNDVDSKPLKIGFGVFPAPLLNEQANLAGISSFQTLFDGEASKVTSITSRLVADIDYQVSLVDKRAGVHDLVLTVTDTDGQQSKLLSNVYIPHSSLDNYNQIDYVESYVIEDPGQGVATHLTEFDIADYSNTLRPFNLLNQLYPTFIRAADTNGQVTTLQFNYAPVDSDGVGAPVVNDAFPQDANESVDTDSDGIGNNADTDDDGDNIPDEWELANGLDPLDPSDAILDGDNDGLSNLAEFESGSNPRNGNEDSDNDGFSNIEEKLQGTDPLNSNDIPSSITS
jgi:hypothetical protein